MSDQPLSDDELASAMLDGESTGPRPADAAVSARVDELRRAADAIAQPVVVDDASRERAIAAALQAFDDAPPVTATATEPVTAAARRTHLMPALAAVAAAVLVGLLAFLRYTRYGLIIRAGVENRAMVTALGIDVRRAFTLVFALGGMAAALAGVLSGVYFGVVDPGRGTSLLIFAFIVVVIGGFGSIGGTAVAAVQNVDNFSFACVSRRVSPVTYTP